MAVIAHVAHVPHVAGAWRWQRLAIDLAVGSQGHGGDHGEGGRQHVVRQEPRQRRTQLAGLRRRPAWNNVGHQPEVSRPVLTYLTSDHHSLAHPGFGQERRLDLPQLDAEAADLDLVVDPPQVLDLAARQMAGQVAGPVEPRPRLGALSRGRGSGDEALRGQIGAAQVAAGETDAADAELARDSRRRELPAGIDDVDPGVFDRPPDGDDRRRRAALTAPEGGVDRHFGGAVEVGERGRQPLMTALDEIAGESLAATEDTPQAG
ncbi:MAG: hypothetical protein QOJ16_1728 [Acidobacteriota bacterium]|nr:hypothetical protein [Acidobacteriota bacterium]